MFEYEEDMCLTNTDYNTGYSVEQTDMDNISNLNTDLIPRTNQYHSLNNLNELLSRKKKNDLFAMHLNTVSLVPHFDDISSLISAKCKVNPDILCISETRFKDDKIDYQV